MSASFKHERNLVTIILFLGVFFGVSLALYVYYDFPSSPPESQMVEPVATSSDGYLHEEEMVMVETLATPTGSTTMEVLPVNRVLFEYVEVTNGCGPHFEGECLNVRSGPGIDYPAIASLRNGMVLKVGGKVDRVVSVASTSTATSTVNETWYKIVFDEWLRYPERVTNDWYVNAEYVDILLDEGSKTVWEDTYSTSSQKQITVDRSEQKLYAYEGDTLFLETDISTGLALTPTPRGSFTIFKKTPSRYMQGPLPNLADRQVYDLPGVPWNLYFTEGGAVIHGAYWHDSFGSRYSHGCVNLEPSVARRLYNWAELSTTVIVKD